MLNPVRCIRPPMTAETRMIRSGFSDVGGFTLLEILLVIFIFGIVMTTILGSFNAIFGNVSHLEKKASQYDGVKTCLDRISEDLRGLYITPLDLYSTASPDRTDEKKDIHRFWAETVSIGGGSFCRMRFSTTAHLPFENSRQKGVAQIIYDVRQQDETVMLNRSDSLFPYPAMDESTSGKNIENPVLSPDIRSFTATFYDAEGNGFDHWDSDSDEFGFATPKAVKIQLELGDEEEVLNAGTMVMLPAFRSKKEP